MDVDDGRITKSLEIAHKKILKLMSILKHIPKKIPTRWK